MRYQGVGAGARPLMGGLRVERVNEKRGNRESKLLEDESRKDGTYVRNTVSVHIAFIAATTGRYRCDNPRGPEPRYI